MLNAVKSLIAEGILDSKDQPDEAHALELATAALLIEVGYADFDIKDEELDVIATALTEKFDISNDEIQSLLASARQQQQSGESMHPFVRKINDNFSAEEKVRVIETMWRVAYADMRLDKYEEHRIRKIADLLYVPHRDFIRTKLMVQDNLQDTSKN